MRKTAMKKRANHRSAGCWIDIYSGPDFSGQLRRLFGPADYSRLKIGSLIVGPDAYIKTIFDQQAKQTVTVWLTPELVMPDLKKLGDAANLRALHITDQSPDSDHLPSQTKRKRVGTTDEHR